MKTESKDPPIGEWLIVGSLYLAGAGVLQSITMADERYEAVMLIALILSISATIFFVAAFRNGGTAGKVAAALLLCPTLCAVGDFLIRAPYVYHLVK